MNPETFDYHEISLSSGKAKVYLPTPLTQEDKVRLSALICLAIERIEEPEQAEAEEPKQAEADDRRQA
jgi:hypothetical protein